MSGSEAAGQAAYSIGGATDSEPSTSATASSTTGGNATLTDSIATGGAAIATGGATATDVAPLCATYAKPIVTGRLFAEASGISGIVASRDQPGVMYIHSDRQKILYAIDSTGALLGQWELSNGSQFFYTYNWEDISIESVPNGPDKLWVGDIGNNYVRGGGDPRTSIKIMSISEPTVTPGQAVQGKVTLIDNLEYTYPDALHDAEGMAMDPLTGDLYVFAKEETAPAKIFRAPSPLKGGVFEEIGTVNIAWANGADFSPSGRELLVRNYSSVYYWTLPSGMTWLEALKSPPNKESRLQYTEGYYGEALAFGADAAGFYVVSEQDDGMAPSPVEYYAKTCK
ncbi:MAG TPA: hypothetical protein VIV60_32865 [Polyangiaceae bacterium]